MMDIKKYISERDIDSDIEHYVNELETIGNADDDGFPDFIFDILFGVDKSDPYYEQATKFQIPEGVLKLRRRYIDFNEWIEAMEIYDNYMDKLAEWYGDEGILKETYNAGLVEEYVPTKPKLKMTKQNKQNLRAGIAPPIKVKMPKIDIKKLTYELIPYDEENGDLDPYSIYDTKLPKALRKIVNKASKKINGSLRADNYIRNKDILGSDLMHDLLSSFTDEYQKNNLDEGYYSDDYIDMIENSIMSKYRDPDIEAYELKQLERIDVGGGRFIRGDEKMELEIIEEFAQLGINLIDGSNRKDMVVKLAKKSLKNMDDDVRPMTKKELKKYKKQHEKERKFIKERAKKDPVIGYALLAGEKDFSDPRSQNMIDFTLDSVFR